ncbi:MULTISPECIES: NadS family protein [Rahnella]|jgi:putative transcriptional regulator|uniref:NadS family protein n=1 Tax=Rahnella sp. (strain Y9602) TaxID=2703885 RepID=A0A0H3F7B9_RAHSY|nr:MULTISPECIES: NadS family protein [Rahnella]AFE56467.1 XRE family transcriptional regulator [Rahnella aquatilis HX2]AYA05200.1 helix-turn-helix domain-containing protein [Rahnella aquatilis]ADW71829.1 transcriptional regulator, XRE family [Rahnella aceris]AZP40501.1 helix-turn-helix domain-containing protein [Rahnella aquatilis]AZP44843.1 helix-turn-helix domain-containing protein [Rahnella aquatilis]
MTKEFFEELRQSAEEMVAIHKGEMTPAHITRVAMPEVKQIRTKAGIKQDEFARLLGVSPSLVQAWEQQKRLPNGAALKLLKMLELNPQIIQTLKTI